MESPENLALSSAAPTPSFLQPEVKGIYLPGTGTLGLWSLVPKVSLPIFIHHTWMWDHPFRRWHLSMPHCIPAPLCPSPHLYPLTCLDECGFFKSLVVRLPYSLIFCSGCYLFWGLVVIPSVIARGGKACLPAPLSWPEVWFFYIFGDFFRGLAYGWHL